MKDENGIEIFCENCKFSKTPPRCKFGSLDCLFIPSANAYKARIAELQNTLAETEKKLTETVKLLSERSRECGKLQALLEIKNKSNISTQSTDCDVSKNGEKSTESEQSHLEVFTIEEIDFTKKAISMAIFDCETNPPKPSDENLKLMWSIKSKCDAILKANVRENRTLKESEEK